jgi:hypothetical protein
MVVNEQTLGSRRRGGISRSAEPSQPKHKVLWASLATVYLALAAFGATQIRLPSTHWLPRTFGDAFQVYGVLTGGNVSFNYFAPGVGSDLRVRFEILGSDDGRVEERWPGNVSREASLKINNIVGLIANTIGDEKLRRSLAASWAGKVFSRHPTARKVTVRIESYEPPRMRDWRRGDRSSWRHYYKASFVRK